MSCTHRKKVQGSGFTLLVWKLECRAHHDVPILVDNHTVTVALVGTEKLAAPGDSVLHTQKAQGLGLGVGVLAFECRAHNNVPNFVDNHSLTIALVGTEDLASPGDSVLHTYTYFRVQGSGFNLRV